MTVLALAQHVVWYVAVPAGCVVMASLVLTIAGIDNLQRVYSLRGKIGMKEVRVRAISFNEQSKKLEIRLALYFPNRYIKPVWLRFERVAYQLDLQSHQPPQDLGHDMEVQPEASAAYSVDDPISVDPSKAKFDGWVEAELKYGRNKNSIRHTYKTSGPITVHVFNTPVGWSGNVIVLGGKSTHS